MSKILDKSQIIHIVSEIIVLFGLTFYFTQKNNKLMGFINDLNKKIEDQESIIQKHEQMILKLINNVDNMDNKYNQYFAKIEFERNNKKDSRNVFEPVNNINSIPSLIFEVSNNTKNNTKNNKTESKVEEIYENLNTDIEPEIEPEPEPELDTDLDAELAEELSELS